MNEARMLEQERWIAAKIEEWLWTGEKPDLELPPDSWEEPVKTWYNE